MPPVTRLSCLIAAAVLALSPAAQAKEWTHVVIATEGAFPPYNMHAPDGSLTGFEIDYAHALCDRMKVTCDIIAQDWDGIIPGLQAGKYDAIMAAMSITPKRQEVLAFAGPYVGSPTTFAISKDAGWHAAADRRPRRAGRPGCGQGRAGAAAAGAEGQDDRRAGQHHPGRRRQHLLQGRGGEIRTYKTTQEEDLDMQAGRIDVIIGSKVTLVASLDNPAENAVLAGPALRGGATGIGSGVGLRKGDPELQAMFDGAIKALKADGTHGQAVAEVVQDRHQPVIAP